MTQTKISNMKTSKQKIKMKSLIIAGTYKQIAIKTQNGTGYHIHYNVYLFGQTSDRPTVECIGFLDRETRGFDELQELARERFCKYFDCDAFNIISMEVLNEAK